jgi:phospholipid/cholesterol/gamma-HCH transport system substrate-binding protein
VAIAGCGFKGVNSLVLPGGKGTGDNSYTLTIQFANVANLVPNSEVKLNDVTVGTVKSIRLVGWQPTIEVGVEDSTSLPENTSASVGQKSLLGAQYVELAAPADSGSQNRLRSGSVIPIERTSKYPETEEVLGSLSVWLNGGALEHIRTITTELNRAFGGNEQSFRNLVAELNTFVGTLDSQKMQITNLIDQFDQFGQKLSDKQLELADAIDRIEPGLRVLNQQRNDIINAAGAMATFGDVGTQVINGSHDSLVSVLTDLQPILDSLVKAAPDFANAFNIIATVVGPVDVAGRVLKGDDLSVNATVNLTAPNLIAGFVAPIDPQNSLATGLQAVNPLLGPLTGTAGSPAKPQGGN